jgi:hypothetical protein
VPPKKINNNKKAKFQTNGKKQYLMLLSKALRVKEKKKKAVRK